MSLKRIKITVKYWLIKKWKIFYFFLGLVFFFLILPISNIDKIRNQNQINDKFSIVSLRHSLTSSSEQYPKNIQKDSGYNFKNLFSTLNQLIYKSDNLNNNLITLFSSEKLKNFNFNYNSKHQAIELNFNDQLEDQLSLIVKKLVTEYEKNFINLSLKKISLNQKLVNIIKEIILNHSNNNKTLQFTYTDQWQPVIGPKEKSRVYSAFYEPRLSNERFIRIIGAARTAHTEPLFCAFWYLNNEKIKLFVIPAINSAIRENWNLKYSAYYLLCPLNNLTVPNAVSVLKKKIFLFKDNTIDKNQLDNSINNIDINKKDSSLIFHSLGNFILIQNNFLNQNNKNQIAICVKPLHYEYNKLDNLIEFIELNKILGINHFLFYNHTVGSKVDCLLKNYALDNLITILPWQNLNMESQKEIRTEGIFASLNDCLYRTMNKYDYVAMIDLDEFIIPYQNENLIELLNQFKQLTSYKIHKPGAFSFKNSFFYLQWLDDEKYKKILKEKFPLYLTTIAKTKRSSVFYQHRQRSKLIILPNVTVEVGNHFVWQFLPSNSAFHVNERAAFLHHYRICEFGGTSCLNSPSVIDHKTHYWSEKLINSSLITFNEYNKVCNWSNEKKNN